MDGSTEVVAVPLTEPREGLTPLVETRDQLAAAVQAFAGGTGPVAVDAERASGYRYSARAYLVQLRRAGAGTALIDPVALPDLSALGEVLADCEWVLHAASQDLRCLREVGLVPHRLFDTELAGRIAGQPRVGLGPIVESLLGVALEKGHSAADWSQRPLPAPMLRYAALDVELLVELRDLLAEDLERQGKSGWASEEFAAVLAAAAGPAPVRREPWRRTSGIHRVRGRRGLAAVRALWQARDDLARERDISPGRVLPDSSIVAAAQAAPATSADLAALPAYRGRGTRRHLHRWWSALAAAAALPEDELPEPVAAGDGPPPAPRWAERDPAAAARLTAGRAAIAELAERHAIPAENLLTPDTLRRLCWSPPEPATEPAVGAVLREHGARDWQVQVTAPALAGALAVAAPVE